jgi:protocatechuate 3,4-dioxygenase beta subunit
MLTASAAGFSLERMNRVAVDGEPLEIQLAQQGCAQGRVIDAGTKTPLTSFNCAVRLVNPGTTIYGRPMQQADFRNAKDGAFELCGLEPGTYVVQASAPDYAPTYSGTFRIDQGMTVGDVLVEISRGGLVRGRVVDASTGEPISGAEIGTFDNGYVKNPFTDLLGGMMPRNTTQALARTDRDGNFELSMLTPETYQLEISHHGHTTLILKDLKVVDSQDLELGTLEMAHGATVRGVVYGADGAPLPNAEVHARANEGYRVFDARSGPDGRYVITSIPAGSYTVSAARARAGVEADPFGPILDMKKSETGLTVSEGGDHNVDLYLGGR